MSYLTKIILEETLGIERIDEPVTLGIPFPKGLLWDKSLLGVRDQENGFLPLQTETLATWADNSLKWVLFDFRTSVKPGDAREIELNLKEKPEEIKCLPGIEIKDEPEHFKIDTKAALFWVNKGLFKPFDQVVVGSSEILDDDETGIVLTDDKGNEYEPLINKVCVETSGSIRTTLKVEGQFRKEGKSLANFLARIYFYCHSSRVKVDFTIHNPRAAKHPGGLWDLGDPGSIFFKDLSLRLSLKSDTSPLTSSIHMYDEPSISGEPPSALNDKLCFKTYELSAVKRQGLPVSGQPSGVCCFPLTANGSLFTNSLVIYQDSSGGDNWKSKNHVNRNGEVKNSFRGYRIYSGEKIIAEGNRANPIISFNDGEKGISAGVQYFWQNFPKSLEIEGNSVKVRIFPHYYGEVFELQGGEQKTHTIFMEFSSSPSVAAGLEWIQSPLIPHATPEWYAQSNAIPYLLPEEDDLNKELVGLIQSAIEGEKSFFKRREIIDEYGWRNFGEWYADHEAVSQKGSISTNQQPVTSNQQPVTSNHPLVSHYNNQYDCINGALTQFLRSGKPKWFALADQLCRHVKDIDIYHTDEDRPGFNHGLFWHTEHYLDAQTATHRCFSKNHASYRNLAFYGGGPALSHNYSSGMLLHYYLTGERSSMEGVLDLASFVKNNLAIEETLSNRLFQKVKGLKNFLGNRSKGKGFVQIGKVYGLDGPGRASGNSLNTLLDVLIMTKEDKYLDLAEDLLKQCASPKDNFSRMDLLDTENRWMYTVFLQALGKYLDVAGELPQNSHIWEYARKTLIHYAKWMTENEHLYLDKSEKLEFPNETWAAQDIRKCNILLMASKYGQNKIRKAFLVKAGFFHDEALRQLVKYDTKTLTRPLALVMLNGMTYGYWKSRIPNNMENENKVEIFEHKKLNAFRCSKNAKSVRKRLVEISNFLKMERLFWKWHILYNLKLQNEIMKKEKSDA